MATEGIYRIAFEDRWIGQECEKLTGRKSRSLTIGSLNRGSGFAQFSQLPSQP